MKDYSNTYYIASSPESIYNAITKEDQINKWTKGEAKMGITEGSEFSMWDGQIKGKNLSFELNKKLVQQWYFDEGKTESIVSILIEKDENGSKISLSHTHIPNEMYESFRRGWQESYFEPLAEYLS